MRRPKIPKFLSDEDISRQTIRQLRRLGYNIKAVAETISKGHEDDEIVTIAKTEDRIIMTHDLGFGSMYYSSERGQVGALEALSDKETRKSIKKKPNKSLVVILFLKDRRGKLPWSRSGCPRLHGASRCPHPR